jgi:hypothetical protein
MMRQKDRFALPSRWTGMEGSLPPSLAALTGPTDGVVELPPELAWSGRRAFDLAVAEQRYLYHMTVLTAAVTPTHYTRWLNPDLLVAEWPRLRLPRPLRQVWQDRFPELRAAAGAGPG